MTSRLKRKLDDVQPSSNMNESFCQVSQAVPLRPRSPVAEARADHLIYSDHIDISQIGTPLPALANTKKDDGEFVPLWKQEVSASDQPGRDGAHLAGSLPERTQLAVLADHLALLSLCVQVTDEQGRRRLHGAFTGGFSAGYFNSVGSKEGWTPSTFVSSRNQRAKTAQKAEDFMDEEDLAAMREDQKLETREGFGPEGAKGKARSQDDRCVGALFGRKCPTAS